jgi:hypothetical protein
MVIAPCLAEVRNIKQQQSNTKHDQVTISSSDLPPDQSHDNTILYQCEQYEQPDGLSVSAVAVESFSNHGPGPFLAA